VVANFIYEAARKDWGAIGSFSILEIRNFQAFSKTVLSKAPPFKTLRLVVPPFELKKLQ
tara:strand:- start:1753 stop:1929 length:177 start_codon:yes stop_codon:yes gene_type:complete